MSEIRVDTITEKTSGSGTTVSNLKNPNSPFRNLIINGDMQIWQRATSATTATDGGYNTVDRWHNVFYSTAGAMTSEREALSVADQATTGMYYCNLLKCTTADTSIATDSIVGFRQTIEAQNCQSLNYGTSAAKNVTISFYAKANASKTYSLNLWKRDSTSYYWFKDISVTDSWQKFTYTISPTAGSTSLITSSGGAIANDNGEGLELTFILVAGTNYDGTADTWQDSGSDAQHFYDGSIDNFLSSTDNTLRITGVQLEVGETATDFEHLPFDVQLQRCQRYFTKFGGDDAFSPFGSGMWKTGTVASLILTFPTKMNHEPTMTIANATATHLRQAGTSPNTSAIALDVSSTLACMYNATVSSGGSAGQGTVNFGDSTTNCTFSFDSEL